MFDRREFLKWAGAMPLFGTIAADSFLQRAKAAVGKPASNIYTSIGVRPFINARGTWTYLSGSLELPEVRAAKQEAAKHFVDIFELQRAAGKRLAELSGAESGMVASGAAGAIASATAACMAGTDPAKIWQLPDTTGLKNEVIMSGGRSAFDSAVRLTGAKLVVTPSLEEMEAAIGPSTAMIYTTDLGDKLQRTVEIAKKANVPLLLDDAAGIPPIENLRLYARMGVDLYCFSGGKGLAGPQCSGLLLGRKDLIDEAVRHNNPNSDAIGRGMKVSKEQIVGMVAALDWFLAQTDAGMEAEFRARAERIAAQLKGIPSLKTTIATPNVEANAVPHLLISYDQSKVRIAPLEVAKQLRAGKPSIELNPVTGRRGGSGLPNDENTIVVGVWMLQPGEEAIVARRLREVLGKASA